MKFRGRAWVLVLVMLCALATAALALRKGFCGMALSGKT